MKLLLDTLNKNFSSKTPIWLMRQAGRYLTEYRLVRKNFNSFMEFCLTPEAACEVTLQPLKRFGLDAAIIFSDILVVPYALGLEVEFKEGVGPLLPPICRKSDLTRLSLQRQEEVFAKVFAAISKVKKELIEKYPNKALIGFAGAPWTVASYMTEGKSSKDFTATRSLAYADKDTFEELIDILVKTTIAYLKGQIKHGAEVIKLFDSWAGVLPEEQFRKWVIAPTKKIVSELKKEYKDIPIIGFPKGASLLYRQYAEETGVDGIACDHTLPVSWMRENLQSQCIVQGNLDNVLLAAGNKEGLKKAAHLILNSLSGAPFIFNLGHGVLPNTPVANVEYLVEVVKSYTR